MKTLSARVDKLEPVTSPSQDATMCNYVTTEIFEAPSWSKPQNGVTQGQVAPFPGGHWRGFGVKIKVQRRAEWNKCVSRKSFISPSRPRSLRRPEILHRKSKTPARGLLTTRPTGSSGSHTVFWSPPTLCSASLNSAARRKRDAAQYSCLDRRCVAIETRRQRRTPHFLPFSLVASPSGRRGANMGAEFVLCKQWNCNKNDEKF